MTVAVGSAPHYPSPAARHADFAIHLIGLGLALAGAAVLLSMSLDSGGGRLTALSIYAVGLIAMLSFSLAYNLHPRVHKPRLRRLDHIGIFLMIAGTYTPLTATVLVGSWAWAMTAVVWSIAGFGILCKAADLPLPDGVWTAIYVALGWLIVVAFKPIAEHLSSSALTLLIAGGVIYTVGSLFYITEKHRFWRAIWHVHVLLAATCHWAAIFTATR